MSKKRFIIAVILNVLLAITAAIQLVADFMHGEPMNIVMLVILVCGLGGFINTVIDRNSHQLE